MNGWPKGKPRGKWSIEKRRQFSESRKGHKGHQVFGINLGEKNKQWKGNKVSYGSLHHYIKWHLPKTELCQSCNDRPPYDLANISQEYKRDLSDWEWLCRSCHMRKDGRIYNLKYQS